MSTDTSRSTLYGSYSYSDVLKTVYYGPGSVSTALPALIRSFGVKKALIVTGTSLRTKTDVVKRVEAILSQLDAFGATFSEIGEHAPIAGINAAVGELQRVKADFVVSVGGGSPIDAAKAIIYKYKETPESGGTFLPHFAIPTTLSAAEYTYGAGYTNEEGHKASVSSTLLAPAGIILDGELTLPTPERLWLSTGMRAVDHAVENLYRPFVPHPVKILCYGALAELFKYLRLSKEDPTNVEYRQRLQVAAWMSLWPLKLEKYGALGLSRSLGHKLGATYHIGHGITSCLTLAPAVALQAEIASPENKQYLADALFCVQAAPTGSVDGDVLKLSQEIDKLVVQLGLKTDLSSSGVPRGDLPVIAERAVGNRTDPVYPKVVKLLEGIFEKS